MIEAEDLSPGLQAVRYDFYDSYIEVKLCQGNVF